ncbi:hypothetical protein FVE85_5080 [Porphyridium purpureum]|uniref:DUF6737 domain-containing protein n=1 Tax=Porphyridium purpureum TaxID=35688 RepID=A0A5J4Z2G8_PORPP|nr:hypothetical protein FVE85_5080 [Porphyridium purpureum]|eukprot:POR9020..scf295_1
MAFCSATAGFTARHAQVFGNAQRQPPPQSRRHRGDAECRCIARSRRAWRASVTGDDALQARSVLQIARDAQQVYGESKPAWCQPWTILSTGAVVQLAAWQLPLGVMWKVLFGVPTSVAVGTWWFVFLVLYPAQVLRAHEE